MKQLSSLRVKLSALLVFLLLISLLFGAVTGEESPDNHLFGVDNSLDAGRAESAGAPIIIYGDVRGNGRVTIDDAIMLLRYITGSGRLTELQKLSADVDKNGNVNINDVIIILRYVVGIIDKLPFQPGSNNPSGSNPGQPVETPQSDPGTVTPQPQPDPTPEPKPAPQPSPVYTPNHRIKSDGILYGLDYWKNEVRIATAPAHLTAGDYIVKDGYTFYLISGSTLVDKGKYYYLKDVPYAVMNLDQSADPVVTASFIEDRVLARNANSPFRNMGEAFIRSQEIWGINALYLLSHAALESAWGLSKIAKDKKNLFGYKAYDSDPYNYAGTFRSMEECILYLGGYIRQAYLSSAGRWYNGPNLEGMNVFYATDPMWKIKIARIMSSVLPQENYKPVTKKYYEGKVVNITTHLNLRRSPSTSSETIGTLSNNLEVEIIGMKLVGECNWYHLSTKAGIGWACGKYIELKSEPEAVVYINDWYMVDKEPPVLNVRSGPGTSHNIIDKISFAKLLTVKEISVTGRDAWYRVSYEGSKEESWVNSNYVIIKW